jgi:hypothetical protein
MNKSIQISLVPDDKKEFNADMFHDDKLVKQASLTSKELKDFIESKVPANDLSQARLAIKLFKSKSIKIHLKE